MKKTIILCLIGVILVIPFFPVRRTGAENSYEQGISFLDSGKYEEAIEAFSLSIETLPYDYKSYNKRGIAYIGTGNTDRAVSDFTKAIELNPLFEDAFSNRCAALSGMGNYDQAIEDCSSALEINPRSAKAYNKRGIAYIGTGNTDRAVSDFTKAIELNPLFEDAFSNRCAALCGRRNYDQAIEDCSSALEINPRSAKAYNNRGIAWINKGSFEKAIDDCIKAVEINPGYADPLNNLAWIYATCPDEKFRSGQKAVSYAEQAVKLSPDPYYMDTLAAALAENNRFEEAVEIQEKVIAAAGDNENTDVYEERLKLYKAHKPLRDTRSVILHTEKTKEPVKPPSTATVGETPVTKAPEQIHSSTCGDNCPYTVQTASFTNYRISYDEAVKLRRKGEAAFNSYVSARKGTGGWYRVHTGAFKTRLEAQKAASGLREIGISGAIAVKTPYVIILDSASGKDLQRLESDKFLYYTVKDKKGRKKIFVGAFETEKDAKYFSARLEKKGYKIIIGKR